MGRPASVVQGVPRTIEGVYKSVTSDATISLVGVDKDDKTLSSLKMWADAAEHAVWTVGGATLYADRLGDQSTDAEDHLRLVKGGQTFECTARVADTQAHADCWGEVDSRAPEVQAARNEWVSVLVDFHGELGKEIHATPPPSQTSAIHTQDGFCGENCEDWTKFACWVSLNIACDGVGFELCGPFALVCGQLVCGPLTQIMSCQWITEQICEPIPCCGPPD
jgi:hypothetical protein